MEHRARRTRRQWLLAAGLLAVLLLLAGCSGTPGATTPASGDTPAPTGTPAAGTDTPAPTGTPTAGTATPAPTATAAVGTDTPAPTATATPEPGTPVEETAPTPSPGVDTPTPVSAAGSGTTTPTAAPGTRTGTPTAAPSTPTPTPAPGTQTPTAAPNTQTPTATPTSSAGYPPGYGPDGVEDPEAAAVTHADTLADGRGFVATYNSTLLDGENRRVRFGWKQAAETGSEEVYTRTVASERGTQERYLTNDTVYVRNDPPGENNTEYETVEADYRVRNFTGGAVVFNALNSSSYAAPTTETVDGTTYYRYNMTAPENPAALFGGDIDEGDVESFGGAVTVDENGVVRRIAYEGTVTIDGSRETLGAGFSVGGMGRTTVSEPEWLDEAKESS